MLQLDPPRQCHPEVHPKCLLSTKNWPEKNKKCQKRPKRVILFVKIPPLENVSFLPFLPSILLPCLRGLFQIPNFNLGICFHGDMRGTIPPLFRIFGKNFNFFTDPNIIEVIAQNCAPTKGPMVKMHKTNFEVHRLRTNFHLLVLIQVLWKCPQCGRQIHQRSHFWTFSKKVKNGVL